MLVDGALIATEDTMWSVCNLPGSPIDKIRALSEEILDESGTAYFMLMHQVRTSEGVPEKVRQLMEHYSMDVFVKQLLPMFREGQQEGQIIGGHLESMISSYLSVLSGLMVLNVQEIGGYRMPKVDMLLRMITPSSNATL